MKLHHTRSIGVTWRDYALIVGMIVGAYAALGLFYVVAWLCGGTYTL